MTATTDVLKVLTTVNGALGTINQILPAALLAYSTLYGAFKRAHPEATLEDFTSALLTHSLDVEATSESWLVAHGYRYVDGQWIKS